VKACAHVPYFVRITANQPQMKTTALIDVALSLRLLCWQVNPHRSGWVDSAKLILTKFLRLLIRI
jgi:hypothetical protein